MPILITDHFTKEVTYQHVGCVVEIINRTESRNLSDTLDYSDYQTIGCVYALTYVGREILEHNYVDGTEKLVELPVSKRFQMIDCSNHFAWRGSDLRQPTVDANAFENPDLAEDYACWTGHNRGAAFRSAELRMEALHSDREMKKKVEHDRPVVGKRMLVKSGRKVKPGYEGTVAFVHRNGGVLLKKDNEWKDRKAQGVWVDARHLQNRDAMK